MLMRHRSVTRAATGLNLPQPTVSRCIARLREQFGDVLFVRTRAGMEPTPMARSEEHTSELQSLMRISYAVFCLKKKNTNQHTSTSHNQQILHPKHISLTV